MKKRIDRRGSNIHSIEPVVDICIRDVSSSNNVIMRIKDTPLSKALPRFENVVEKYGFGKKTLWEHWELELIEDIKAIKLQLKEQGILGSIKKDFAGEKNGKKTGKTEKDTDC